MFKVSYFMEVLPIIASKVNVTFELTIAATIFALIGGCDCCNHRLLQSSGICISLRVCMCHVMRGTPVVAQLYPFLLRSSARTVLSYET